MDVGGTLVKVVYFKPFQEKKYHSGIAEAIQIVERYLLSSMECGGSGTREKRLSLKMDSLQGELHFMR